MFEMTLRITSDTCYGDLREFIEAATASGLLSDAMPIANYNDHDELDGISLVVGRRANG